jgi:16S rRNA (adenine1518-N6/adenine1519-N6)-dimethyltransferase
MLNLLRESGIRLSRRAGQHLMVDHTVLGRMVDYAELSPSDTVLEIGAGVGNLTALLAERAGKVLAVEKDHRLFLLAQKRLRNYKNIELRCTDFLEMELPSFDKVVSNLPFGISSEVTFRLLQSDLRLGVLTYQTEFAKRLVAQPGSKDYSRLTVAVRMRAEVELLEEVPPSCFFPPPKVSATVVRLRPRAFHPQPLDWSEFEEVLRALFQHRRQQVRNALLHSPHLWPGASKSERRTVLQHLPAELAEKRVLDMFPEEIVRLSDFLSSTQSRARILEKATP